ncbi:MAG: hypothetical protein LBB88_12200 [Planctomycetaceae bacterium]|jgi:hypothetical protein|nr:hypothetical protein [Planctomycetaceae bacterium]
MERRCFKSAINDSKEIALESFQTDFQPNRPFCFLCPLKKTNQLITAQSIVVLEMIVGKF